MNKAINLNPRDLTMIKNFYSTCLSLGFVKVERDNEQDITVLRLTDTRFEHYTDKLPFKVGKSCFISPKVSANALNILSTVKKEDNDFMNITLIKNKYLKIKTWGFKTRKVMKYKCKLWTINFM